MDASLETPASAVTNQNEAKDESSADEDQVLDWSKVAYVRLQTERQVTRTDICFGLSQNEERTREPKSSEAW